MNSDKRRRIMWMWTLTLLLVLAKSVCAATPAEIAADYVATVTLTNVDSAKLGQMGSDFSETEFRKMVEGTFDPFVISAGQGSAIRVRIENDATAKGSINGSSIQFAIVLDPAVRLVYSGTFNATFTQASGKMHLKTPIGNLANGNWKIARKGAPPNIATPAANEASAVDEANEAPASPPDTANEIKANTEAGINDANNDEKSALEDTVKTAPADAQPDTGAPQKTDAASLPTDTASPTSTASAEPSAPDTEANTQDTASASEGHHTLTHEEFMDALIHLTDAAIKEPKPQKEKAPFLPVDTSSSEKTDEMLKKDATRVASVTNTLKEIAGSRSGVQAVKDLQGRTILTHSNETNPLKKKVIDKVMDTSLDSVIGMIPGNDLFKDTLKGTVTDAAGGKAPDPDETSRKLLRESAGGITDRVFDALNMKGGATNAVVKEVITDALTTEDEACKKRGSDLGLTPEQARISCKMDRYDENIGGLKYGKTAVLANANPAVKLVSSGLDFLGNRKRKMLARAGAEEYSVYKKAFEEKIDSLRGAYKSTKQKIAEANQAAKTALEEYTEEKSAEQSSWSRIKGFITGDDKFIDYTILNKDSKFPSVKMRSIQYMALLREDKVI